MGIYIYGISKQVKHAQHGKVGVLKFLYKPYSTFSGWDQNEKWDRQYCNFIRHRWAKSPVRVVYFEGHPETLYEYKGSDGIWCDANEHLVVPL